MKRRRSNNKRANSDGCEFDLVDNRTLFGMSSQNSSFNFSMFIMKVKVQTLDKSSHCSYFGQGSSTKIGTLSQVKIHLRMMVESDERMVETDDPLSCAFWMPWQCNVGVKYSTDPTHYLWPAPVAHWDRTIHANKKNSCWWAAQHMRC